MYEFKYTHFIEKEDDEIEMELTIHYSCTENFQDIDDYTLKIEDVTYWCPTMKMNLPVDKAVWEDDAATIEDKMEDWHIKVRRKESEDDELSAKAGFWS